MHEAAKLLGIEPARFRFVEAQCRDFLPPAQLEIPQRYGSGDLKILAAANRLLTEGLPPGALKSHLAGILREPSNWESFLGGSIREQLTAARLIAVTSGKGGVGKSNVALNVAVELVRSGLRVAVMDADLGTANLHLMAGLRNGQTLRDVISGDCDIERIITSVSDGPDLVPGSSGIFELANLPPHRRQILIAELRKLESRYDVILIDTAAGVAGTVLDFVASSDFVLVVTTAETTSITDAYALIKLTSERNPCCGIGIVVNRLRSAREGAATIGRISNCARRFLGRSLLDMGYIWEDSNVARATNAGVPFTIRYPGSRASLSVRKLARMLRDKNIAAPRLCEEGTGFDMFVSRCSSLAAGAAE